MKGCNSGLVFIPVNNADKSNAIQKRHKKQVAKLSFYVNYWSDKTAVVVSWGRLFSTSGFHGYGFTVVGTDVKTQPGQGGRLLIEGPVGIG